jgi:hypothetical protein
MAAVEVHPLEDLLVGHPLEDHPSGALLGDRLSEEYPEVHTEDDHLKVLLLLEA